MGRRRRSPVWAVGNNPVTIYPAASPSPPEVYEALGLVVDGTNIYWTEFDDTSETGRLLRAPVGGGTVVTMAAPINAIPFAVDSNGIYLVGNGAELGMILQAPKN